MFDRISDLLSTRKSKIIAVVLAAFALLVLVTSFAPPARAATTNFSLATPGIGVIPLHFARQFTASVNPAAKFVMPFAARLIGISGTCRASGGTTPTLTIDLEDDGTSALASAFSVTAGTVAEGSIANAAVVDESVMEIVLTIGGSSPTWDDCTVLITYQRQ